MSSTKRWQEAQAIATHARMAYDNARMRAATAAEEAQMAAAALRRAKAEVAALERQEETPSEARLSDYLRDEVKGHRERLGLRQEDLAVRMRQAGFRWQRVTVAEVERGSRRVSLDEMVMLAAIFSIPVVWMLVPPTAEHVFLETADAEVAILPADDVREMIRGVDGWKLVQEEGYEPMPNEAVDQPEGWEVPERIARFARDIEPEGE